MIFLNFAVMMFPVDDMISVGISSVIDDGISVEFSPGIGVFSPGLVGGFGLDIKDPMIFISIISVVGLLILISPENL